VRARLLVALYPLGWRRRYGEEMRALLDETGVRPRAALDLLVGAVVAHLRPRRPWTALVSPTERMRNTIGFVALCWGALCVAGAGFAKSIEDPPFRAAAHAHVVLAVLRDVVAGLAVASALVVAVVGAPLLLHVVGVAWRERRRDLAWRLALPVAALAVFVGVTALALSLRVGTRAAPPVVAVFWLVLGAATAAVWAGAPRTVLPRVGAPAPLLHLASRGSLLLVPLMGAVALGIVAYAVALSVAAPTPAALVDGPLRMSTTAGLACSALVALAATALAAVSAARGAAAARCYSRTAGSGG
jgi:hypothetical protein